MSCRPILQKVTWQYLFVDILNFSLKKNIKSFKKEKERVTVYTQFQAKKVKKAKKQKDTQSGLVKPNDKKTQKESLSSRRGEGFFKVGRDGPNTYSIRGTPLGAPTN